MFRATLAVNLVIGASVSLLALRLVGRFGPVEIALAGILVPAALIGFWLSRFGILWVDAARVRVAVLMLSAAAALGVLWRAVAAA